MLQSLTESWLVLAFLGPLFWTISDFIDKFVLEQHTVGLWDFLFFFSIFSWVCLALLIWTYGAPPIYNGSPLAVALGFSTTASFYLYARGIRVLDTSQAILTFKLVPIFVIFIGFALFGEAVLLTEVLASLIVLGGAGYLFVAIDGGRLRISIGTVWLVAAVFSWATIFVLADKLLDSMPFEHYMVFDTFGASLFALFLLMLPPARRQIRQGIERLNGAKTGWFFANTLTDFLAQVCLKKAFAVSTSTGMVSIITQVQSIYGIIAGVMLTALYPAAFHENITVKTISRKLIGTGIMISGIYVAIFGL